MNKTELIAAISNETGFSKKNSEKAVAAFIDSVVGALRKGDKVQLIGFGTFEVRKRSARTGRNPRTNAPIRIPACKVPAFKAGKLFKDIVNKK
ncbi:MAG: HU family DNA-binding protein [Clostridia bacterium]|nr:HU family DNA-binding protein [Clostridia bacterium]